MEHLQYGCERYFKSEVRSLESEVTLYLLLEFYYKSEVRM